MIRLLLITCLLTASPATSFAGPGPAFRYTHDKGIKGAFQIAHTIFSCTQYYAGTGNTNEECGMKWIKEAFPETLNYSCKTDNPIDHNGQKIIINRFD